MTDHYERTFSVAVPVERAWRAFTDPQELEVWFAHSFDATGDARTAEAETPGGPVGFEVTDAQRHERLAYRQWAASPEVGIEVTVTFEEVLGGTRITVTQAGFGGESILRSDQVRGGMDETLADLALYLNHGVRFPRHRDLSSDATLGADLRQLPAGVELAALEPQGFADAAGMRPGDVLLQLGRGAVFGMSDVAFFLREHDVGDEVEACWARGGDVMRGSGRLRERDAKIFAARV
ncbi:MAG TPA: SRPBCC domain-containing protein [Acidimicrobiia bacterium]